MNDERGEEFAKEEGGVVVDAKEGPVGSLVEGERGEGDAKVVGAGSEVGNGIEVAGVGREDEFAFAVEEREGEAEMGAGDEESEGDFGAPSGAGVVIEAGAFAREIPTERNVADFFGVVVFGTEEVFFDFEGQIAGFTGSGGLGRAESALFDVIPEGKWLGGGGFGFGVSRFELGNRSRVRGGGVLDFGTDFVGGEASVAVGEGGEDILGLAEEDLLALMEQEGAVAKEGDVAEVVGDEEEGVGGAEGVDFVEAFLPELEIADGEDFVEDEEVGEKVDGDGEAEADFHTGAVDLDGGVNESAEVGKGDDGGGEAVDVGGSGAEKGGVEGDVVAAGHFGVEAGAEFDHATGTAGDLDRADVGAKAVENDFEEGAFTGAVKADDAEAFAAAEGEVDVVQSPEFFAFEADGSSGLGEAGHGAQEATQAGDAGCGGRAGEFFAQTFDAEDDGSGGRQTGGVRARGGC